MFFHPAIKMSPPQVSLSPLPHSSPGIDDKKLTTKWYFMMLMWKGFHLPITKSWMVAKPFHHWSERAGYLKFDKSVDLPGKTN